MSHGNKPKLPDPECKYGYTENQLDKILDSKLTEFNYWMRGQTKALCNGEEYDSEEDRHILTGCGPHGPVTYRHDLERFLNGEPIID